MVKFIAPVISMLGKNVGTINYFYSNGNPDMDQVYNDDNILVAIKQYDSNGNVLDSATLPNGNGKYTQHYENGQLQSIATYVMGRLNELPHYILSQR